jgi:hypothetical protein
VVDVALEFGGHRAFRTGQFRQQWRGRNERAGLDEFSASHIFNKLSSMLDRDR